MKSERFKRTKSVMASGAIALVVAPLAFGISSSVLGTRSAVAQHLGFELTSGASSFTITSSIYPSPACSGSTALLYPATPRCMVFSVHNNLKATISVQSITTALDTTNFPAPPADCSGANLLLPTYSGSLNVPGGGDASSPGVPIELKDNGAPQDDCENYTYHFNYSGSAIYTEVYGTSTGLASSQNPSTVGQSVTYTATVTASATTSQDPVPSGPTGTVTFKDNGTTICAVPVAVTSSGTTTATAECTVNYATASGSPHPITAAYTNTDGNFTNSSASLSQVVSSSTRGTTSNLTSSPNPSNVGQSVTFTDTVSGSSGTPTGTVTFYSCGASSTCGSKSQLGTPVGLNASGKATLATSSLPVGTVYVEAVYGGSGNYGGSTSAPLAQVVRAIATSTSLTSSPNPSNAGQSVTFTATVAAGSGTPGGTVTFYSCTSSTCGAKTSIGTGSLNNLDKATTTTSSLPVGTTYIEAVYGASGNYSGSTSTPLGQVVKAISISTSTSLTSSPNPSTLGQIVTFAATVSSGSGSPGGSVTFFSCSTSTCGGTKTSLGTGNLGSGKATLSTSALPLGTTYVEAVYAGSGNYLASTSSVLSQVVKVSVPSFCPPNGYNAIIGNPWFPLIYGTSHADFIQALGGSYWINGFDGNDCIDAGDGNNVIVEADGNDVIVAGNGSNAVLLGNGNDKVNLGNGSDGVEAGDGNDSITLGNGSGSQVLVGDGADSVIVGGGSHNHVALGRGSDTVTIQNGSHDDIDGGSGSETVFLGSGTDNTYAGQPHHTNTCHLPKPPSSWHGTAAAYYHDTITNCTVVTP